MGFLSDIFALLSSVMERKRRQLFRAPNSAERPTPLPCARPMSFMLVTCQGLFTSHTSKRSARRADVCSKGTP